MFKKTEREGSKTKIAWFFVVLVVVVAIAVIVKLSAKVYKHVLTYKQQRENLDKIPEAKRNLYLYKLNTCSVTKDTAITDRMIVQNYRMKYLPFKHSRASGCDCDSELASGDSEEGKGECFFVCKSLSAQKEAGKVIYEAQIKLLEVSEENIDQMCGWPEGSSLDELHEKLESQKASMETVSDSMFDVLGTLIGSFAALAGAPGLGEKLKNAKSLAKLISSIPNKLTKIVKNWDMGQITNFLGQKYNVVKNAKYGQDYKNGTQQFRAFTDFLEKILRVFATIGFAFGNSEAGNIIEAMRAVVALVNGIQDLIAKIKDESSKTSDKVFAALDLLSPLKDIVVVVLAIIGRDKEAAMVSAVFDLVLSSIELSRAVYDHINALKDSQEIENTLRNAFDDFKISKCESKYNTASSALNAYSFTKQLDKDLKLEIGEEENRHLKREIKENCYLYPANCLKLANSKGDRYFNGILDEEESLNLFWISKEGPISDIVVSTAIDYDQDFLRDGYFQISADVFENKLFACRGCRMNQIIAGMKMKLRSKLTSEDRRKRVLHISYDYSLVLDIIVLSSDRPEKNNIRFVKNFSIEGKDTIKPSYGVLNYDYADEDKIIDVNIIDPPPQPEANENSYTEKVPEKDQLAELLWYFNLEHCNNNYTNDNHECFNLGKGLTNKKFFRFKSQIVRKKDGPNKYESQSLFFKQAFTKMCADTQPIKYYSLRQNVEMREIQKLYHRATDCVMFLQIDGLLATYSKGINIWNNNKYFQERDGKRMILSDNGQLIISQADNTIWTSIIKTPGKAPFRLELDNRCRPIILDNENKTVWNGERS